MTDEQKALIAEAGRLNSLPALQDHDHTTIMGMMLQAPDATQRMRDHVEDLRARVKAAGGR